VRESVDAMGRIVWGDHSLEVVLSRLLDLTVAALPRCDGASLILETAGHPRRLVGTDEHITRVDNYQYRIGEGPCVSCLVAGGSHEMADASPERWPHFSERARDEGFMTCLAVPVGLAGRVLGALNLYSRSADAFGLMGLRDAALLAEGAAYAVVNAQELARNLQDIAALEEGLNTVDEAVAQAIGILRERLGMSTAEACEDLIEAARRPPIPIHEVARRIVESAGAPGA
jgi:transcriptional regulator with GAF, ATPase, and Fis domain